eukprot:Selendium_serpulae@DN5104_c0_g1_i1.p1
MRKLGVCLCQIPSLTSKFSSVVEARKIAYETLEKYVQAAVTRYPSCDMVVLPEAWALPYATKFFVDFAEEVPGIRDSILPNHKSATLLSNLSSSNKVYIVGGSIAERSSEGKLYNTCLVTDPSGTIIAKHRKTHLFDIDIPGRITFKESDTLSPGGSVSTFSTPWGKMGVGICYDVRFPELAMVMRQRGAKVLVYPGAFNTTTGSAHWSALMRARAIDTQSFVLACSPAAGAKEEGDYPAWGHSMAVDPWGTILSDIGEQPGIAFVELDFEYLEKVRAAS